jgi:Uncharacterised nucleotidyltransferase
MDRRPLPFTAQAGRNNGMTAETEFLLATVRGAHPAVSERLDWQALLDLAESHGVLAIFCKNFKGTLPELFADRLRTHWIASAYLSSELQGLLKEFDLQALEVLPLKGPLMAEMLYGSPGLRPSDDLDLLVRQEDFARAQSLLSDLGFSPIYETDDYHQAFQRNNTCVELHFSVAPPSSPAMDLKATWGRAQSVAFRGEKARAFAQPDLLVYLTLHGVKHQFARFIWVLDAERALASMDDESVQQALKTARTIGIEGAFLTTCELVRHGLHAQLPAPIVADVQRKPAIAAQSHRMWTEITTGSADPTTMHQGAGLFVDLEPQASRRWKQRLRLFLPSQQDQLWAQKHSIPVGWMMLLRPARLLSKHGPTAVWRTLFPRFAVK